MRISDWSSDVCSSDLLWIRGVGYCRGDAKAASCRRMLFPPSWLSCTKINSSGNQAHEPRAAFCGLCADGRGGAACASDAARGAERDRSEEHTSELQSLMRISSAVFCLKKNTKTQITITIA